MSSKRLRNVSRPDNGSTSTEYFPKKKKVDNEQTAKYNEDENFLILEQQTLEHINFPKRTSEKKDESMSSLRSTEAQANDATEVLNYFRTWITFKNRSFLPARYRAWLFDNMYLCEEMGEEDFRNFLQFCIRTSRGLRRKRIRRDAEGIIKDLKVELDELKSGKFVCKNRNIL